MAAVGWGEGGVWGSWRARSIGRIDCVERRTEGALCVGCLAAVWMLL